VKFLAIEHESSNATAEQFKTLLEPEARQLWNLVQSGLVRETYFRADRHEAVLILECNDPVQADLALKSLPLVQAGLISFELIPLAPYDGFARLFK
jgi:hypothetical protein